MVRDVVRQRHTAPGGWGRGGAGRGGAWYRLAYACTVLAASHPSCARCLGWDAQSWLPWPDRRRTAPPGVPFSPCPSCLGQDH